MIIFKEKCFGDLSDSLKNTLHNTLQGAAIGSAIGGGVAKFYPLTRERKVTAKGGVKTVKVKVSVQDAAVGGALIGAALGLIGSAIKETANYFNKERTVNNRLLPSVVKKLEAAGHKEGMSFTRDPKHADTMKTKVSLVIYKFSDDLRIVVNSESDKKLDTIMNDLTKKMAQSQYGGGVHKEEISGKYKDLKITAISDPSTDADYIAWVASNFINNGYPVYLVEVG